MNVGFVRTVQGDVASEALGIVLPHEHLRCTQLAVFKARRNDPDRLAAHQRVTRQNAVNIRKDPLSNIDNHYLPGGAIVASELQEFVRLGGRTLVDLTTVGLGRDVKEAARLSRSTGLHVIVATGYYVARSHPPEVSRRSESWLVDRMAREVEDGIDGSSIRAGVIGELGTSAPIHPRERKVLAAAAGASQETGCGIVVHVQPPAWQGHEVLDLLFAAGARADRIALAHIESTVRPGLNYQRELLSRGVMLGYDGFGLVWDFPSLKLRVPSDEQRADAVVELMADGFRGKLLLSQDICTKVHLSRFGGPGYAHLLKRIVPMLKVRGCNEDDLCQLMQVNPSAFLSRREAAKRGAA
jgi:phosphotriesterase-related protein